VAAFAEPLACYLHGMDLARVQLGNQVLLIGAVIIGLILLQLSKLAGASRLTVTEPVYRSKTKVLIGGMDSFGSSASC